jgi:hypothetical protein
MSPSSVAFIRAVHVVVQMGKLCILSTYAFITEKNVAGCLLLKDLKSRHAQ